MDHALCTMAGLSLSPLCPPSFMMWLLLVFMCAVFFLHAAATTLSFDGTQYMRITLPEESRTEAEDISLRFKTNRPNGLLFATTSATTTDRLELVLEDGKVRLDINLGSGSKVRTALYGGFILFIVMLNLYEKKKSLLVDPWVEGGLIAKEQKVCQMIEVS